MNWEYAAKAGELLGNGPAWLRKVHARMLGRSGNAQAAAPLCAALKDEAIAEVAAQALIQLGEPAVLPLCEALKHSNSAVRWWAAEALGRIMDPRAVQPLCEALEDEKWNVCAQAIKALRRIGDPGATPPLVRLLTQVEWSLRAQVVEALGRIGDPMAAPPLIELLGHADWDVRRQAAGALEEIGHDAVRSLCQAIRHESGRVREQVAAILGRIGDLRALLPLCSALQEGRLEAATALAELARRAPVADLEAVLPLLCERAQYVPYGYEEGGPVGIARAAIQRLAAEGAARARLPIPAAASPPTTHGLPLPAGPPQPAVESLPVPAGAGAGVPGHDPSAGAVRSFSPAQTGSLASGWTQNWAALHRWWQQLWRRMSGRS